MKPDRLEQTLASYARDPLPAASEPSTTDVWQAIERRRRQSVWSRIFPEIDWRDFFSEPRMAAAALAFAIIVGVVPAAVFNRVENEQRLARQSIHFDVFAADAGALGSVFAKPVAMVTNGKR